MQYKGSELMREVAWIIFDEVHYMRDRERGVVWEESIVMAPKNSRFVFLSATVPNAKEFADWVAKVLIAIIFIYLYSLVHRILLIFACLLPAFFELCICCFSCDDVASYLAFVSTCIQITCYTTTWTHIALAFCTILITTIPFLLK